jgi:hypothetical protein
MFQTRRRTRPLEREENGMDLVSELRLFGEDLVSGPCYNANAATIGRAADAFVRLQAELRSRCPAIPRH